MDKYIPCTIWDVLILKIRFVVYLKILVQLEILYIYLPGLATLDISRHKNKQSWATLLFPI